jgi:hypothetical protein
MLSDLDPHMESRYQTAAILHGPYSPFWTLSIVLFSRWVLDVGDWVDKTTMHLSIPAWTSADSTVWPVYAANLRDPKSQFSVCMVNVGTMRRDRRCPQTANMQGCLWSMDPYQILSQLLRIRVLFVFRSFSYGVMSWLRYWSVCSNVECLRLMRRRDFQMTGGG